MTLPTLVAIDDCGTHWLVFVEVRVGARLEFSGWKQVAK